MWARSPQRRLHVPSIRVQILHPRINFGQGLRYLFLLFLTMPKLCPCVASQGNWSASFREERKTHRRWRQRSSSLWSSHTDIPKSFFTPHQVCFPVHIFAPTSFLHRCCCVLGCSSTNVSPNYCTVTISPPPPQTQRPQIIFALTFDFIGFGHEAPEFAGPREGDRINRWGRHVVRSKALTELLKPVTQKGRGHRGSHWNGSSGIVY